MFMYLRAIVATLVMSKYDNGDKVYAKMQLLQAKCVNEKADDR